MLIHVSIILEGFDAVFYKTLQLAYLEMFKPTNKVVFFWWNILYSSSIKHSIGWLEFVVLIRI